MSMSVSPEFIFHVQRMFFDSLKDLKSKNLRLGINVYAHNTLSTYVLAAASVESFVNEVFLCYEARLMLADSPLWNLQKDWTENLELGAKLIIVPQLLFGKSFKRDENPYQDMKLLIKIRNDIIHYKMEYHRFPKYIAPLSDRKILLSMKDAGVDGELGWEQRLSCSEGIRWAHNTACYVVKSLMSFVPEGSTLFHRVLEKNFEPISRELVVNWMIQNGIDPVSNSM